MTQDYFVDCDFAGGNILVDSFEGDTIFVHQDLRDTTLDWFYWAFRVRGAARRTLQICFTGSNPIGALGPAASLDGGLTWRWLGLRCVQDQSFTHTVPEGVGEVRFSVGMPYTQANLGRFLAGYAGNPALRVERLCMSRKDRPVEIIYAGKLDGMIEAHILLTCRHHCCEMMASYSLEGMIQKILDDTQEGVWLREHVDFLIFPFMDKDGVEDGDQGKCRAPHDHNRDYVGESIYPEVAALRRLVPEWCRGKLDIALDLHGPWIRGGMNEYVYFVGGPEPLLWRETNRFGEILEKNLQGPIPYKCMHNLPFGEDWNTGSEPGRKSNSEWAREFPGIRLGNCIEIPYANASGVEVNPQSARQLGADLAKAISIYLQS